jgi:protein SCO1
MAAVGAVALLTAAGLNGSYTEDQVAAYIDQVRADSGLTDELVPLLHQSHFVYDGRGANAVARLRGYLLASFEEAGLPDGALPHVLEALENSQQPYVVAAAAKAVRGCPHPFPELAHFLLEGIRNIQYRDDELTFRSYRASLERETTAIAELLASLAWLGPQAAGALDALETIATTTGFNRGNRRRARYAINSIRAAIEAAEPEASGGCCASRAGRFDPGARGRESIGDLTFEDHRGQTLTFEQAFTGAPTVAAFFYTRCANPNKCSLTVTKLGLLQRSLRARKLAGQIRIAAITYDPGYDTPDRLAGYCTNRGLELDDDNRALRADPERLQELRTHFDLGVNYSGSVVSRHRIELHVVAPDGTTDAVFADLQWDVEKVADVAAALLSPPKPELAECHSHVGVATEKQATEERTQRGEPSPQTTGRAPTQTTAPTEEHPPVPIALPPPATVPVSGRRILPVVATHGFLR